MFWHACFPALSVSLFFVAVGLPGESPGVRDALATIAKMDGRVEFDKHRGIVVGIDV